MSRAHSYSHSRAHSPTFPSLHLCHSSFSNHSVALPTSQLILQSFSCLTYVTAHSPTFFRFSYVTGSSLTSPGEPPMYNGTKTSNRFLRYPKVHYRPNVSPPLVQILSKVHSITFLLFFKSTLISSNQHLGLSNSKDIFPSGLPTKLYMKFWILPYVLRVLPILVISFENF